MIAIISLRPEVTKAQSDSASFHKASVKGMLGMTFDARRSVEVNGGIFLETFRTIQIDVSVASNASFGLDASIFPFKSKWFALSVEGDYYFTCKYNFNSLLEQGIDISKAFSGQQGSWVARALACSPNIKIQVPIKKVNLGITLDPFVFGMWDYYKAGTWVKENSIWVQEHGWSKCKQNFTVALYCNVALK